jgi:hypothetical protein
MTGDNQSVLMASQEPVCPTIFRAEDCLVKYYGMRHASKYQDGVVVSMPRSKVTEVPSDDTEGDQREG